MLLSEKPLARAPVRGNYFAAAESPVFVRSWEGACCDISGRDAGAGGDGWRRAEVWVPLPYVDDGRA